MENLSLDQARDLKQTFLDTLPAELKRHLGGVGICLIDTEVQTYGIKVNLLEEVDASVVLSHLPESLRDNVSIELTDIARVAID